MAKTPDTDVAHQPSTETAAIRTMELIHYQLLVIIAHERHKLREAVLLNEGLDMALAEGGRLDKRDLKQLREIIDSLFEDEDESAERKAESVGLKGLSSKPQDWGLRVPQAFAAMPPHVPVPVSKTGPPTAGGVDTVKAIPKIVISKATDSTPSPAQDAQEPCKTQ